VAIVQSYVAQTSTLIIVLYSEGVTELVTNATERPLLGEVVGPRISVRWPCEGTDVLNDPSFLVVRLLDEKAVVLDLSEEGWSGREEKSVNGKQ
jgi:hypothetical protein